MAVADAGKVEGKRLHPVTRRTVISDHAVPRMVSDISLLIQIIY
jgi:hypothetical protein